MAKAFVAATSVRLLCLAVRFARSNRSKQLDHPHFSSVHSRDPIYVGPYGRSDCGPSRKRRPLLWWSLLTIFMPLWIYGSLLFYLFCVSGPLVALLYLAAIVAILASETYCGVLLGAKMYSESFEE